MGRTWCRTDPLFVVDGVPLKVDILADARVRGVVESLSVCVEASAGVDVQIPPGQDHKKEFGVNPELTTEVADVGAHPVIVVNVRTSDDGFYDVRVSASLAAGHGEPEHFYGEGTTNEEINAEHIE